MRRLAAYAGLAVLALAWLPPWPALAGAFPGHMARHMALVAVAAPLLVLGFPRASLALALPPLAGTVLEFAVVWGWHLPAAHALGWTSGAGRVLEQAMFLGAGLALWAGVLAPGTGARRAGCC
jgi:putative membrane protein